MKDETLFGEMIVDGGTENDVFGLAGLLGAEKEKNNFVQVFAMDDEEQRELTDETTIGEMQEGYELHGCTTEFGDGVAIVDCVSYGEVSICDREFKTRQINGRWDRTIKEVYEC